MKAGLNFHLAVKFDLSLDDVAKIEFIFAPQISTSNPQKYAVWPGDVTRKPGENVLLVPWTAVETRKFDGVFLMDTRITMRDSEDQPETPIIKLRMSHTLFEEGKV